MNYQLNPGNIFIKLLYLILALVFFNVLGLISKYYFNHPTVYGLVPLFDLSEENNVPTLYASFTLLVASFLLLIIAIKHKMSDSASLPWFGLSIIFLFLSIDEFAQIHEQTILPFRNSFNTSGYLLFAWVIPYGIGLIVFVIAYLKFLIKLPRNIMFLFIISGAMYVIGALGFELLEAKHSEAYGFHNVYYSFLFTCEESLEMLGVATFIYALLKYIVGQFGSMTIIINDH